MSRGVCKSEGCNKIYNNSVSFTPPYCRECSNKRWNEKYVTVDFTKYPNRMGWYWSTKEASGYAFTKYGAIRQARKYVKKSSKGSKKFTMVISA